MLTTAQQLAEFRQAVALLGGARTAAAELGTSQRTIERLLAGIAPIHLGYLRDIARALIRRADACRLLERRLSPAFAGNLIEGQRLEDGRRARWRREAR